MNTQDALSFLTASPFIALILQIVFSSFGVRKDHKWTPLAALAVATAWGGVLVYSGYYDADLPVFIVSDVSVAFAVTGIFASAGAVGSLQIQNPFNFTPASTTNGAFTAAQMDQLSQILGQLRAVPAGTTIVQASPDPSATTTSAAPPTP